MKKDRLVVIYNHLWVGGIENYVIELFKACHDTGKDIFWLCHENYHIDDVYADDINNCEVHIITKPQFKHKDEFGLADYQEGKTVIVTFAFFDYVEALEFFSRLSGGKVSILLLIPHFDGYSLFPEQAFNGVINRWTKKVCGRIYKRCTEGNNVLFFNSRHIDAVEDNYAITINNKQIVQGLHEKEPFREDEVVKRYNSDKFTIVSAGRFYFPHKGYLIGLIKLFAELKEKYPKICLLIIGDGKDLSIVEDTIKTLPKYVQKDIELRPSVSLSDLQKVFKQCNLCVSVAGCVCESGKVGLVSLPARHYTYDCEVYGFFPESRYCTTEDKKGYPAKPYIERVINASLEEYVKLSRDAYESFAPNPIDKDYLYKLDTNKIRLSKKEKIQLKLIKLLQSIVFRMGNKDV